MVMVIKRLLHLIMVATTTNNLMPNLITQATMAALLQSTTRSQDQVSHMVLATATAASIKRLKCITERESDRECCWTHSFLRDNLF